MDTPSWDEWYRSRDQVFSGNPNAVLVTEASGLPPGRVLDVGCGEGADARWLAGRGWQVTAVDISPTALTHAATDADLADGVKWTQADLITTPPAGAPGGTLLFATHDLADLSPRPGFDPSGYYQPNDIATLLDDSWTIHVNETRPRTAPAPVGTHHTHDTVLRAQRLRRRASRVPDWASDLL